MIEKKKTTRKTNNDLGEDPRNLRERCGSGVKILEASHDAGQQGQELELSYLGGVEEMPPQLIMPLHRMPWYLQQLAIDNPYKHAIKRIGEIENNAWNGTKRETQDSCSNDWEESVENNRGNCLELLCSLVSTHPLWPDPTSLLHNESTELIHSLCDHQLSLQRPKHSGHSSHQICLHRRSWAGPIPTTKQHWRETTLSK